MMGYLIKNSRLDVVDKDFPVESSTEEATVVRSKGQSVNGTLVTPLHLNWGDGSAPNLGILTDRPQADDAITTTRCQKSPIGRELDCFDFSSVARIDGELKLW